MEESFIITTKKYRGEKSLISVRLPDELIAKIDHLSEQTNRSRNDIICKSLEFALARISVSAPEEAHEKAPEGAADADGKRKLLKL